MYNIHLLPASYGDSILIEYGSGAPKYILIDGGPYTAFKEIIPALKKVAPKLKKLELLVITHVDIDHIDGTIMLLNQEKLPLKIKEIWFNGEKEIAAFADDILGALQGEYLTTLINKWKLKQNVKFGGKAVVVENYSKLPEINLDGGMKLTLLSPGKEALKAMIPVWKEEVGDISDESEFNARLAQDKRYDYEVDDLLGGEPSVEELQTSRVDADISKANASSIAFIASYKEKSCLFSGDATTGSLLAAIEPLLKASGQERLPVDAWKLSHHGSKRSTLAELMQKISCCKFLISSDGKRFKHPNKESIARILKYNGPDVSFYFNYHSPFNEKWKDAGLQVKYSYKTFYPPFEKENGISLSME